MENAGQPLQETKPMEDRLSRLSQASLRINESLDVDAALRAVMARARSLTRAPYLVITILDDSGRVDDHLALGLDPDDVERLWQAPEGTRFFEYLNALQGQTRAGLLEEVTRSIGLGKFRSPVSLNAFMAAPILHQGVRSGNIYVGSDKPGREFSQEDEETLVLFASQAAQMIANSRRHREEQQARTLASCRKRSSLSFVSAGDAVVGDDLVDVVAEGVTVSTHSGGEWGVRFHRLEKVSLWIVKMIVIAVSVLFVWMNPGWR